MEDTHHEGSSDPLSGPKPVDPPSRAGATSDLPMVVWLTGDEPYFSDFKLDAEAVMGALNIKRSRLTQISGRELRVGRTRIDRYIRPMYREEDVQEYLTWTKPTATSKRSSEMVEQAAAALAEQSALIEKTLKEPMAANQRHILRATSQVEGYIDQLLPRIDALLKVNEATQHEEMILAFRQLTDKLQQSQSLETHQLQQAIDKLQTRVESWHLGYQQSLSLQMKKLTALRDEQKQLVAICQQIDSMERTCQALQSTVHRLTNQLVSSPLPRQPALRFPKQRLTRDSPSAPKAWHLRRQRTLQRSPSHSTKSTGDT